MEKKEKKHTHKKDTETKVWQLSLQ